MTIMFRVFRSSLASWETLFEEAGTFASSIGKERLINITHSDYNLEGIVVVWYWA